MEMVVAGGDGGDGVMVRGAPPCRPGCGGGRRWRRRGEGERCDARPDLGMKASRDFVPTVDQPILQFGPPPFLLSFKVDPLHL